MIMTSFSRELCGVSFFSEGKVISEAACRMHCNVSRTSSVFENIALAVSFIAI